MFIVFETGSADWVNIDRPSGFTKSKHDATVFNSIDLATAKITSNTRYQWMYNKGTMKIMEK